jgi:hypothetical protein
LIMMLNAMLDNFDRTCLDEKVEFML